MPDDAEGGPRRLPGDEVALQDGPFHSVRSRQHGIGGEDHCGRRRQRQQDVDAQGDGDGQSDERPFRHPRRDAVTGHGGDDVDGPEAQGQPEVPLIREAQATVAEEVDPPLHEHGREALDEDDQDESMRGPHPDYPCSIRLTPRKTALNRACVTMGPSNRPDRS